MERPASEKKNICELAAICNLHLWKKNKVMQNNFFWSKTLILFLFSRLFQSP